MPRQSACSSPQIAAAPDNLPLIVSIKPGALEAMSIAEVQSLRTGITTMLDVGSGLVGQPKFRGADGKYNAAGRMMEHLCEGLGGMIDDLLSVAIASKPLTEQEAETRAWCILQARADYQDELSEIAVDAVQALRDVEAAQFDEKFAARTGKAVPA